MVVMSGRPSHLWSNEEYRGSMIAALRSWNSALRAGVPEQMQAASQVAQICEQYGVTPAAPPELATSPPQTMVPQMTVSQMIDHLLDFPSHRLAAYGSLAPGKKNHHMMAGMEGTWRKAVLRGSLRNEGWGAGQGFPGFLWDGSNAPVAAQVFSSRDLPRHWQRLDDFEGAEYQRILVPVEMEDGEIEMCNVYELAKNFTTDEHR
jgi:gamma-glutamylcyclotransferase (GGCT)/AIG2-like uncharacterized protein YtfP